MAPIISLGLHRLPNIKVDGNHVTTKLSLSKALITCGSVLAKRQQDHFESLMAVGARGVAAKSCSAGAATSIWGGNCTLMPSSFTYQSRHMQVSNRYHSLAHCELLIVLFWLRNRKCGNTPWKINMEPKNHLFEKENHLPNLHYYVPC